MSTEYYSALQFLLMFRTYSHQRPDSQQKDTHCKVEPAPAPSLIPEQMGAGWLPNAATRLGKYISVLRSPPFHSRVTGGGLAPRRDGTTFCDHSCRLEKIV